MSPLKAILEGHPLRPVAPSESEPEDESIFTVIDDAELTTEEIAWLEKTDDYERAVADLLRSYRCAVAKGEEGALGHLHRARAVIAHLIHSKQ